MSFNNGYSNPADRAALLSGLRAHYHASQQTGMGSVSSPMAMNQSLEDLQYMMLQQQMQLQQPLPFNQQYSSQQQQQQHQYQQNSTQAQLYALQQSQMELQLQQIKMANLALQEQILMQHQQQARAQQPAQVQQQQQQQQQAPPVYGDLAALGAAAASRRAAGRSVSAGAALPYMQQPVVEHAHNSNNWRQADPAYSSSDTSYQGQGGNDLNADARHEVRRGALQNLQQARQRSHSPAASVSSGGVFSPPMANLDWQAQRMQYNKSTTPEATVVVTPPAQIESGKRDLMHQAATAPAAIPPRDQQHRKNISDVSDASIQSLSISEAGSHFSPNRGPALVLSKPGDEFPDEDDDESTDSGPMSPSLTASMRAASIHSTLAAADQNEKGQQAEKRRSSSGRHTVILSSSIVDLRRAAAAQNGRNSPFTDSDTSSTASSPTSDKSEVASFESSNSTAATSLPNTSPTSINFDTKPVNESKASLGLGRAPSAAGLPQRRAVSAALSASLNPSATAFAPGPAKTYPSSLSAGSTSSNTPLRIFSAPARNGTPTNVATILRQPKGPADEKDMPAKNFAGMIRRRAVGALRLAAASGARSSPASSPVLAGFPGNVSQGSDGFSRFASPASNATSPLAHQTTFNMSDLATRALRRRSQQPGLNQGYIENPGLGMM